MVDAAAPPASLLAALRAPLLSGLTAGVAFFGGFGGWATFAPLDGAAIASGVLSVESSRKAVQHLEGGIVGAVLVRDGDFVEAGQPLVRLDETRPRAALEMLKVQRAAAAALSARLIAERDGSDEVSFPDWLAGGAEARAEENVFMARRQAVQGQTAILSQQISQHHEEIAALSAEIVAARRQGALIGEEIADVQTLFDKGLERKARLLALQRQAAEIEGEKNRNEAMIAKVRRDIGETELKIVELRTAVLNEAVEGLRETQEQLAKLGEEIRAAEDVLTRTMVAAPSSGVVVNLQVHAAGAVIQPGQQLMELVPQDDRLVVEARVEPGDVDVVHSGLPAQVKLTAFNQRYTPTLDGRVEWISADRLTDQRTGQPYYVARVELAEGQEKRLDWSALHPGMPAEVMIATGSRTMLDYLVSPLFRALDRAGRES
jgi:HlyD family type I secretion membrane fusion protein